VECGNKSDELSKPRGANSFIQYFIFFFNRQTRIGGVQLRETVGLHA